MDVSLDCSLRQARGAGRLSLAQAGAFQLDAVGTVNDAIQNGVSQGHVTNDLVPATDRNLAGD